MDSSLHSSIETSWTLICMFRTPQKYFWKKSSCGDCPHLCGYIITSTVQSRRPLLISACRRKAANINSRNYYELLGVERSATQKEIKKAFFELSKEYHPDSNSADKSLHEKFVKINQAFSTLSKQASRVTYDQSLTSLSRYPHPTSRPSSSNEYQTNWASSQFDKSYFDAYRRKMEYDRQRTHSYAQYQNPYYTHRNSIFGPISVILVVLGFGMFIHALQWRIMQFSDPQLAYNPRNRHYYAYREWQRLTEIKNAESKESQGEPLTPVAAVEATEEN